MIIIETLSFYYQNQCLCSYSCWSLLRIELQPICSGLNLVYLMICLDFYASIYVTSWSCVYFNGIFSLSIQKLRRYSLTWSTYNIVHILCYFKSFPKVIILFFSYGLLQRFTFPGVDWARLPYDTLIHDRCFTMSIISYFLKN